MKIGFVFDDSLDKNDGIQQYMLSLQRYYLERGHEVHFLVGQSERDDIPNVHSLSRNMKVNFNGNALSIPLGGSKRRIRGLLRQERFDVLHVQVPYHPLLAGRIIRAAGPETVVYGTFHVAPYSKLVTAGSYLLGLWSKPTLKRFDKIVSVSTAAARLARTTFRLRTEIIPNVFDYQRFAAAQPLPRYDDDVLTILFLGRLVPRKGCQHLLRAIADIQAAGHTLPKYRVVICGGGQLEQRLKQYVTDHGLKDIVSFAGKVSEADKPNYYASADIAVFPSSGGESFGIVLIEAMASGRAAVLGGDNPGYRTVLGPSSGQLFPATDSAMLSKTIIGLLTDTTKRQTAAEWGRQESARYDVKLVGEQLLKDYHDCARQQ